jgi:Recombination endonuclease VII
MADPHKKSTYVRKYYLANRQKWLSRSKAWREAHREEVLAKGREYRKTNGHKIRARANARRVARHEEVLAKEMARRNGRRADIRAYLYAYHLKRKYGLTIRQYDDLLHAQKGRCAICGTDKPGHYRRFVVDHCHESGGVRGLLCERCNTGLGYYNHEPQLLSKAAAYLADKRISAVPKQRERSLVMDSALN